MKVHYQLEDLPVFRKAVITIGTFDGVHKGHQKIIDALLEEAKRIDGESVLITFHPHPRKIVQPINSLQLLNTLEEKTHLLSQKGIDHLVIVSFDQEFASQTPGAYIENFLVRKFNPYSIIIGYDHHFGKDRKGNIKLLETQMNKWNYKLIEVPKHVVDEIAISSTKIRQAVLNSEIEIANKLLGYDFFFTGKVVHGDKLGRELGFPTANIEYTDPDKIRLGEGVYASYATINNERINGMLSIGNQPTLPGRNVKVEINLFDFDRDIYDKLLKVTVTTYLRKQEKYSFLEDLKHQLSLDKVNAITALTSNHKSS